MKVKINNKLINMSLINKFIYLLIGIVIFYCNSIFAVGYAPVTIETHHEYVKIKNRLDELHRQLDRLPQKDLKDKVVLKVYIDDVPEVNFFSGQSTLIGDMGGICPEIFFHKGLFEQDAAHLLEAHYFPVEQLFNFNAMLEYGVSGSFEGIGELTTKLEALEKSIIRLKDSKKKAEGSLAPEDMKRFLKDLDDMHSKKKEYAEVHTSIIRGWFPFYKELVDTFTREGDRCRPRQDVLAYTDIVRRASSLGDWTLPVIEFKKTEVSDEIKKLMLYCNRWGKHAEDVLIYKLLSNLGYYPQASFLPRIIEIYGNKDPCPQCQIKLQWLVMYLARQLKFPHGEPLIIRYYSKNETREKCLHEHLPPVVMNNFITRKDTEKDQIKEFTFSAADPNPYLITIFPAIKPLIKDNAFPLVIFNGQYEGIILESPEDGASKIKIESVLNATFLQRQGFTGDASKYINVNILPEDLIDLGKFYTEKTVSIVLSEQLKDFATGTKISFEVIDDGGSIKIPKGDGFYVVKIKGLHQG